MNHQAIEKATYREDGVLDVVKIWRTIQGEGPLAGTPATFIRLAGCPLQCPLCDTDYTSSRSMLSPRAIVGRISRIHQAHSAARTDLVVLTGGEPLRQNLGPLLDAMRDNLRSTMVQIETNGVYPFRYEHRAVIVVSPKTSKIDERIAYRANAWKYIVRAGEVDPSDGLPTKVLGYDRPPARPSGRCGNLVFVQPADEQDSDTNERNLQAAIGSCMKFGYRLSLQTHKLLGME